MLARNQNYHIGAVHCFSTNIVLQLIRGVDCFQSRLAMREGSRSDAVPVEFFNSAITTLVVSVERFLRKKSFLATTEHF